MLCLEGTPAIPIYVHPQARRLDWLGQQIHSAADQRGQVPFQRPKCKQPNARCRVELSQRDPRRYRWSRHHERQKQIAQGDGSRRAAVPPCEPAAWQSHLQPYWSSSGASSPCFSKAEDSTESTVAHGCGGFGHRYRLVHLFAVLRHRPTQHKSSGNRPAGPASRCLAWPVPGWRQK